MKAEGQTRASGPFSFMNSRQKKTLAAIFAEPTRANVLWDDVESLLRALGAEVVEGNGLRVRVKLGALPHVFHRPHPAKETNKPTLRDARELLEKAGFAPEEEDAV